MLGEAETPDKYYVPTRYPNAWADEYYTRKGADNAIRCTESVIARVEGVWRSLRRGARRK